MVSDEIFSGNTIAIKEGDVIVIGSCDCFVEDCRFPKSIILVPNVLGLEGMLIAKRVDARLRLIR
jgi:hypothetical protein